MVSNSLIVLGAACVDFQGEQLGSSLQDMLSFKKYVGQAAAFALGFSRLGLKTALVSQVGTDAMGTFIIETLKQENVDVSQLKVQNHTPTLVRLQTDESFESYGKLTAYSEFNLPTQSIFLTSDFLYCEQAIRRARDNKVPIILYLNSEPSSQLEILLPLCDLVLSQDLITSPHRSLIAEYAFMIGYASGWIHKVSQEQCLKMAQACHDLVQISSNNSQSLPSLEMLSHYLTTQKSFSHLQYVTTRPKEQSPYFVVNLDQNQGWQKAPALRAAIIAGLEMAVEDPKSLFLITDNTTTNAHIVRPVEDPGIIPLRFRDRLDVSQNLRTWPKDQRAKITIAYHPDDRFILKGEQEKILDHFYKACRTHQHELWVEITTPANSLITAGTLAHVIRRFYEIGIYPDIWQIPPPRDQRSWDSLTGVISSHDPHCRGVLISAQHALLEQLPFMFTSTAQQKYACGFVVNNSVFQKQLEAWRNQLISTDDLSQEIAALFKKVMDYWHASSIICPVIPSESRIH